MLTTTTEYGTDMLDVARGIWGNRNDQRFGGNRRWRQLQAQFPELAAAARPTRTDERRSSNEVSPELARLRDEAEEEHKLFERWARSQTAARSAYHYSGSRNSVMHDAESSSPKWMKPYGCWHHTDRGRWSKANGAGPDDCSHGGDDAGGRHRLRGRDLRTLHAETDGGYSIEGDGARNNQLEVCRVCRTPLDFERDEDGRVVRKRGEQPEYCSPRCKLDVFNARRREQRRIKRPKPQPKPFDLSGVSVAGLGRVAITAQEWNRMQPRSRPNAFMHAFDSPPKPRPWFNPPKARSSKYEYRLPLHRLVAHLRHRPCLGADPWIRVGPRSQAGLPAERIARRWSAYGAGRDWSIPEIAPGWDTVSTSWRYPAKPSRSMPGELTAIGCGVWRIAA